MAKITPPLLATYRLQLSAAFDLRAARSLVPYLHRLGISHLYLSPLLRARTGSEHGYDVVDPTALNPQLGQERDLARLHRALASRQMGVILDIVPNHMAASDENPFWEDLLAHGKTSRYAAWFDVHWDAGPRGRILLPVLSDWLGRELARQRLSLVYQPRGLRIRYFDQTFPLDPATWVPVLREVQVALGGSAVTAEKVEAIIDQLAELPRAGAAQSGEQRSEVSRVPCEALFDLYRRSAVFRRALKRVLADYHKGRRGEKRMKELLESQVYRLAFWRRAAREINYRRFFTISTLVGVRQEDPEVFRATHRKIFSWVASGWVAGLRVDHVDGLLEPAKYLARLRGVPGLEEAPIFVEKILAREEALPAEWPVSGTTGYDFLAQADDIFFDFEGLERLQRSYSRALRSGQDFAEVAFRSKMWILKRHLAAEVSRLAGHLERIAVEEFRVRSFERRDLEAAIRVGVACLPVYRTYLPSESRSGPRGLRLLLDSLARAKDRGAPAGALGLIRRVLVSCRRSEARLRWVQRFQQLCVPAAAKGIEDTAFYRYVPLAARNEVGADPQFVPEDAVAELHRANLERARLWPRTMLCSSTHDTKRSADVRARLAVLTEIPERWWSWVEQWRRYNRRHRSKVRGRYAPEFNLEYLLYQTLVGIWPAEGERRLAALRERIAAYVVKAAREAKRRTSWVAPDSVYERALLRFVGALLDRSRSRLFLEALDHLVREISPAAFCNSLSRTLIQLTSPGVPDIYQGDELWNFALVDPDNRRPVDFDSRKEMLDELERSFRASAGRRRNLLRELVENPADGRIKLHVIARTLNTRRDFPQLFLSGTYLPLEVQGQHAGRAVAFARVYGRSAAITIAPRLVFELTGGKDLPAGEVWSDTAVSVPCQGELRSVLSGETITAEPAGRTHVIYLARALRSLPLALLVT
ncbi:MAG: malto-oligosyltrehalose synthase [Gemmatimonadales bacterium]|nr:MAG: malto-oligosyltrehalose synthase [Gemmatimonadales bacterium]